MRLFFGILLAIIGFTLLFGMFSGDIILRIIHNFFNAWPIIFIFIGLSILSEIKGLKWVKYINYALSILFVLYLVFAPLTTNEDAFSGNFEVPVSSEYSEYDIQMDFAVINLEVRYHDEDYIDFQFTNSMSEPDFEINGNRIRVENSYFFMTSNNSKILAYLPENLEYDLDLNSAVVNFFSSSTYNYINKLKVDTAVSNIKIEAEEFPVRLDIDSNTAISNISIYSDNEIRYDIDRDGPFINIKTDSNFIREAINPEITIDIDSAFGNIKLSEAK